MTPWHLFRHGTCWTPDGVRFRLWAPSAQAVSLLLNGETPKPMKACGDGWYEMTEPLAKNGDCYFFEIDGRLKVPDPASRFQPKGVTGPSQLVEAGRFSWHAWENKPWEEAVIYELHIGTFTSEGTYKGAETKLDYLATLGITAIELMPLASFAGRHGWGYDGVFPFAPYPEYGTLDDLKHLINAAHQRGLMVFLDVVYNHFGPEGNFLNDYAKKFFTDGFKTPWGSAIAMDNPAVRDFYVENVLYWLFEYHFDGLRFDAVHAILDSSEPHILYDIAQTVRQKNSGKHLILENDKNEARYLRRDNQQRPLDFTAQWNDDIHHCLHVLLTGEVDGYYEDYKDAPLHQLGRCLTQGFAYQGEASRHRKGESRGEKSDDLPPQAFVSFLQNHDQIGNRAMGERLDQLTSKEKLTLAMTLLLLSPQPPMLFMGEEWGAQTPFLYFCDFEGDLAEQVREGRRNEFKTSRAFADPALRAKIPDPNDEATFHASRLNWCELEDHLHAGRLAFTRRMLELRRQHVLPLLQSRWIGSDYQIENGGLEVRWKFTLGDLCVRANFSDADIPHGVPVTGKPIWGMTGDILPAWHSAWHSEMRND